MERHAKPARVVRELAEPPRARDAEFIGPYRVVRELGVGGMASVHLACATSPSAGAFGSFEKWVALKCSHPHLAHDEAAVQMFLDEARVAARISHPNVVCVFDAGKHEQTYWIAMEYLRGETARELQRRVVECGKRVPLEIACRIVIDAANGLHAAHEATDDEGAPLGLVHCDVTPHNLLVTYDGVTKVVDFGVVKLDARPVQTDCAVKGKFAYMAPEQARGQEVDRRADVFALGVVLWELSTGHRLFRGKTELDTIVNMLDCNITPPSEVAEFYPRELEKIVMKALSRDPNARYRTTRELGRALSSLLVSRGFFVTAGDVADYMQLHFADRARRKSFFLRIPSQSRH